MARKPTTGPTQIIPRPQPDQDAVQQQIMAQLSQMLPGVIPQDSGDVMSVSADEDKGSKRMDDQKLLSIVNQLEERGKSYVRSKPMHRATLCWEYFFHQPTGEFEVTENHRSDFVDSSVHDAVRWLECPLVEAFCGTQKIVDFSARNTAQEQSGEMINAMVNKVWQQNDGYEIMRSWIMDSLIQPAGIVKIYWKPDSEQRAERFLGLSDDEFGIIALAANAGECEVLEHNIYQNPQVGPLTVLQHGMAMVGANPTGMQAPPVTQQIQQGVQQGANPMQIAQNAQIDPNLPQISQTLHDVKVVYRPDGKKGSIKIENIPLEEFYVDPSAKKIKDAKYAAHARFATISELRAMGFDEDLLESIDDREDDPALTPLYLTRNQITEANAFDHDYSDQDPSMRRVLVVEAYLLIDYDGDGIAEWRKVIKAGNTILLNEPCDGNPFCVMTSLPVSHSMFGMSVAELAINIQKQNTHFVRSMSDNVSYGANATLWADTNAVDISNIIEAGPGSVIPVDSANPASAIGVVPNSSGDVAAVAQMLELFDMIKQERTGVMKSVQSNDADMINDTATGYLKQIEQGEARTKLIMRNFAETGVKPAALRIQLLLGQHQNEFMQVRINGQTVEADPMDAHKQYDLDVQVGLGTGDKGRSVAALMQILQLQQQAMAQSTGMVDLNLVYNTVERLVSTLGMANPGEFVRKPPAPMPTPPQPQIPLEKQVDLQIQQQKAQAEQAMQERQAQLDELKIQAQAASDEKQMQMDYAMKMALLEKQKEIEQLKAILATSVQREQAAFQAGVAPQAEQAMFDETFQSTQQAYASKLTGINMHMSGKMDSLLNAVAGAPEPDGTPPTGLQQ
ncbi:portal protein [Caballeronia zhejiangensis]|uniref:portal protein n=1 Tax=Caballeronia zhejiangensis TaxID=871203 RepID=UPI001F5233EE|nr:hypothetical protein [Caballeronia zhejiangensis]MCI1046925.1 hypothetical protein [Caballeronia zhejiangensis]